MPRKLATIQTIKQLNPIEGADFIELATFESIEWQCVVKKGEFGKGYKCVYFEIDSFLPETETFSFLEKSCSKKTVEIDGVTHTGYRLKTMRLKGVLSQGLALPTHLFKHKQEFVNTDNTDLTESLNIQKYEPPIPTKIGGDVVGVFPHFIPKTDETRIQVCYQNIVERYKGINWIACLKYDGASSTYHKYNGDFGVSTRNYQLKESKTNTFWKIAKKYNLQEVLPDGYAIQGEVFGEGIQKNPHKIKGQDLRVFNVYNIKEKRYLNHSDAYIFVRNLNVGLEFVDSVFVGSELPSLDKMFAIADKTGLEGVVFRPVEEKIDTLLGRLSFKVISNNYLLK